MDTRFDEYFMEVEEVCGFSLLIHSEFSIVWPVVSCSNGNSVVGSEAKREFERLVFSRDHIRISPNVALDVLLGSPSLHNSHLC